MLSLILVACLVELSEAEETINSSLLSKKRDQQECRGNPKLKIGGCPVSCWMVRSNDEIISEIRFSFGLSLTATKKQHVATVKV